MVIPATVCWPGAAQVQFAEDVGESSLIGWQVCKLSGEAPFHGKKLQGIVLLHMPYLSDNPGTCFQISKVT